MNNTGMNNTDLLWKGALRPFSICVLAYVLPVLIAKGCKDATVLHPDIGIRDPREARQEATR